MSLIAPCLDLRTIIPFRAYGSVSAFAEVFQQLQQQAVPSGGIGGGHNPLFTGLLAAEASASSSAGRRAVGEGGDGLMPSPGRYPPDIYLGGGGAGLCGGEATAAAATGAWPRCVSGNCIDGAPREGGGAQAGFGVESGGRRRTRDTNAGDLLPF